VVLTDRLNSTKSGKVLEVLGNYDPRFNKPVMQADRIKYWMSVGAMPTDTVHNLLVSEKIIEGKKKNVLPKKTPPAKEVKDEPKQEAPAAKAPEAPVAEEAVAPEVVVEEAPAETTKEAPVAEVVA
jgi:small subunit ribosomal protein S16